MRVRPIIPTRSIELPAGNYVIMVFATCMFAVQMLLGLALIYVQPVAGLLGHVALPPVYWVALLSFAPLLYGFDRVREVLLRRSRWKRQQGDEGSGT